MRAGPPASVPHPVPSVPAAGCKEAGWSLRGPRFLPQNSAKMSSVAEFAFDDKNRCIPAPVGRVFRVTAVS